MQQEDDLRGLARVMDFMRAISILFVGINVYWFCYSTLKEWGVTFEVIDKILWNFQRTTGLFSSILWTKLFAVVFLALSCIGTKGVKEEKITWMKDVYKRQAYAFEFVPVVTPCHDVAVAAHRDKPLAVGFVQVLVYPLLVHLVGTGVAGERLHIPGGLLEVFQVLGVVVYENILVIDVVTRQQHAHRGGKT